VTIHQRSPQLSWKQRKHRQINKWTDVQNKHNAPATRTGKVGITTILQSKLLVHLAQLVFHQMQMRKSLQTTRVRFCADRIFHHRPKVAKISKDRRNFYIHERKNSPAKTVKDTDRNRSIRPRKKFHPFSLCRLSSLHDVGVEIGNLWFNCGGVSTQASPTARDTG